MNVRGNKAYVRVRILPLLQGGGGPPRVVFCLEAGVNSGGIACGYVGLHMGIIQGFRINGDIGFVLRVVEAWHLTILGNSTTYVRRLVQCASSLLVFYVVWNTDNAQLHRLPYQEWNGDTHEAMAITP